MPTDVKRRGGQYPVRLSLNIAEATSQLLDRWELRIGKSRGELARQALELGLPKLTARLRKRHLRNRGRDLESDDLDFPDPDPADLSA